MSYSLGGIFLSIIRNDVRLAWSQTGGAPLAIGFFIIATSLFPLGIGPDPSFLARLAPGVIWVMALFACLLSLDRIYQTDFEDGTLDYLALSPLGLLGVSAAKILAHWVAVMLPLIIVAPLLGVFLNLPDAGYGTLIISLLLGTPALSCIGSIGAALAVSVKRGGVLIALLVLPLYVPVLIFAAGAVDASVYATAPLPNLALTAAASLAGSIVGPLASAASLRLALD